MGKNEKKPTGAYMPSQSAFEKPKTKELYAPPPTRRDTSAGNSPQPAQAAALQEEEEQGEWVVALYDFASSVSYSFGWISVTNPAFRNRPTCRLKRVIRFGSLRGLQRTGGWQN